MNSVQDGHGPDRPSDTAVGKVELVISTLLRVGVSVSLAIVVIGTVVSFVHHPDYLHSRDEFARLTRPGAAFPSSLTEVAAGLADLRGQASITVGLLVLLITPVLRVAVSIFAFLFQRDLAFVVITTAVLIFLLLSFVLGHVE